MTQKVASSCIKALTSAFFVLTACNPSSKWQFDSICSSDPCFKSAKVFYKPDNFFLEPELEVAYSTEVGYRIYINIHGCALPDYLVSEGTIVVSLTINNHNELVAAQIAQGNQRILLPENYTQSIIQSLLNKEEIILKVGTYKTLLPLNGFEQNYQKLIKTI
ncbi:hypothetical protein PHSC3_000360 [Chlamydiales bacterium STE3]|nr:hypothetical protein PHSC3_000360 [Chlamydiales bacterium STE3]